MRNGLESVCWLVGGQTAIVYVCVCVCLSICLSVDIGHHQDSLREEHYLLFVRPPLSVLEGLLEALKDP